jgi:DNA-binding SARP family transcriptional activator
VVAVVDSGAGAVGLTVGSTNTARRLIRIQDEYDRLLASVSALSSELAGLGITTGSISTTSATDVPVIRASARRTALVGITEPQIGPLSEQHMVAGGCKQDREEDAVMSVHLFGPFQIRVGEHTLSPNIPGQVKLVLEYLTSQGRRPASKDILLDLLWPDTDPAVSCGRLRVLMHTLRKSLEDLHLPGQDLVVTSANSFLINRTITIWVDVEEFEMHWHRGWQLSRAGYAEEALCEYEQAEALYTGDYLADEPYAEWTLLRREALRDAYSTILTMLATISERLGDHLGTLIWAQKLLAHDNCREDAYRLLMMSLQQLGQPARATYWYEVCARTLQRELGIEPSAATRALYHSMAGILKN